jgi:hypothetical protein
MRKSQFFSGLLMFFVLPILFGFTKNTLPNYKEAQQKSKVLDKKVLLGNWIRTDADYKIKISEVLKDGKLNAGYFNPKSIHVAKATWTNAKGVLKIYIELRDENYPGSNYSLTYYPEKDLLTGKYFQAVSGETFDVIFTRIK